MRRPAAAGPSTLTPTEFRILARLAAKPGDAVRRRQLVEAAWAHGAIVHDNTLDVYIARLRRKLDAAPRCARDRDRARRRLLAAMNRPLRLGIRTRLLLAAVGAVALALVVGVTAFNLFLGQRLSASATSLARAQAAAELSSLEVVDGKLVSPTGLEEGSAVGSPVWVFAGTTALEKPRVPDGLDGGRRVPRRGGPNARFDTTSRFASTRCP